MGEQLCLLNTFAAAFGRGFFLAFLCYAAVNLRRRRICVKFPIVDAAILFDTRTQWALGVGSLRVTLHLRRASPRPFGPWAVAAARNGSSWQAGPGKSAPVAWCSNRMVTARGGIAL